MLNSPTELTNSSVLRLQTRQLSQQEIADFASIMERASEQQGSARQFLQSLTPDELHTVQKAHSLAAPIDTASLSAEGAQNLLSQPDGSNLVDINNDGIVEIGAGRTIHFPPVNAPARVKAAWEEATANMSEMDKSRLGLTMHHMIYGVNIDLPGVTQTKPLAPTVQWNNANTQALYQYAQSNLAFRVNLEGWTPYNQQLQQVYEDFFSALTNTAEAGLTSTSMNSAAQTTTGRNISHSGPEYEQTDNSNAESDENTRLIEINQLLLDARLGIDREKIKEIEAKMEAVRNDTSLSPAERSDKLQALQQTIEHLIEEARKRAVDEEKRKALNQAMLASGNGQSLLF